MPRAAILAMVAWAWLAQSAAAAPIELPQLWAGLSLGMSVDEFDRIACDRSDCRDSNGRGARISYAINPAAARPLKLLPVGGVPFAIRWATFVRGRLVGFRAAPAPALPVAAREALTTDVWRWLGLPTEALNLLEWCGRAGEEFSYDPTAGWIQLHQIKSRADLPGDEAIDSFCLLHK